MDMAVQLAEKNAPEGTLVIAEAQSKGRGRLGRSWVSPKYKGIYCSLILRPDILPSETPVLTLLAAVSVCEAAQAATGVALQIKWPNDIFSGARKIGGILTELEAELDAVKFVVVGIGINVNSTAEELAAQAASLSQLAKRQLCRVSLLRELLQRFESNYSVFKKKGPQQILDKWRRFTTTIGSRVKIVSHRHHVEGQAMDIDKDGGLLIRQDTGIIEKFLAGDVMIVR
jgi:BirA family biotin operon repressor/biotin-[acetyl-CoA-carboxylase] ligase